MGSDSNRPELAVELAPEHPVDRMAELGVAAEDAGYDAVFSAHHYNNRDAFAALHRIAAETRDISVGPGVANPLEVHPVTLASKMATLAEAAGEGRGVFGIGPGDPSTLGNLGLDDDRGLRPVLEAFSVARRLWQGERVDHDGTFEATDAGLNYEPPGEIPVYVGGEGPHMCKMAAKHAEGLLFNGSHPDDLAWAREQVESQNQRLDALGEFDLLAYASVSVADDREKAREAARPPVAFIAAGAAPPVLERHGVDRERASELGEHIGAGEFSEAFDLVTEPMLDAFCVAGTEADVAERFAALREHADGIVVGSPLGPEPERALSLAAAAADRSR
ncbi:5,10-methylenetetrahydromethanopterin reductase [Halobium salinum]|uniref:5,10-methylenetetrahydromethanopterin reductase n=1 Tax=Halobium salinum TaxID=1364940 RepID=A0ABD5PBM7_9EURY|nr:5,10-methylenetetrahydromethanopterin reductase [Halobium salinum]